MLIYVDANTHVEDSLTCVINSNTRGAVYIKGLLFRRRFNLLMHKHGPLPHIGLSGARVIMLFTVNVTSNCFKASEHCHCFYQAVNI